MIESKSGKARVADRGQAVSNAVWANRKFGGWVDAILCVAEDAPERPEEIAYGNSKLWVMGARQLRPWLESRR